MTSKQVNLGNVTATLNDDGSVVVNGRRPRSRPRRSRSSRTYGDKSVDAGPQL